MKNVISTKFDGENILSCVGNQRLQDIKVPTIKLQLNIEGQEPQILEYRPIAEFQNAIFSMLLAAVNPKEDGGFKKYNIALGDEIT